MLIVVFFPQTTSHLIPDITLFTLSSNFGRHLSFSLHSSSFTQNRMICSSCFKVTSSHSVVDTCRCKLSGCLAPLFRTMTITKATEIFTTRHPNCSCVCGGGAIYEQGEIKPGLSHEIIPQQVSIRHVIHTVRQERFIVKPRRTRQAARDGLYSRVGFIMNVIVFGILM